MALSVASLMTTPSHEIALTEPLPAESINRTVRLVGIFRRRSGPFIRRSSSGQSRITTSLVSLTHNYQDLFGVGSMKYRALLTILFISMAIGIGLAVSQGANSSYLRTALSTFVPSQAAGSSCH
jgi:hypothetical protein